MSTTTQPLPAGNPARIRRTLKQRVGGFSTSRSALVLLIGIAGPYAGYQGWINLPPIEMVGGVIGLACGIVFIAAIFAAVFEKNPIINTVGVLGAMLFGAMVAVFWDGITTFIVELPMTQLFVLAGGVLGLLVAAIYCGWPHGSSATADD